MVNPFLEHRRRRVFPLVLFGVLVLLAAVAVGIGIESQLGPHGPKTYAPPKPIPISGTSNSASAEPSAPTTAKQTDDLRIVQGKRLVNGVRLGYPHSVAGAVSAATEYMRQIGSTLDSDRAAAVGRLVADPSWSRAPEQLAKGPVSTRKALGLPKTGQVPTGASVVLSPVDYQVPSAHKDSVSVLLLATYTSSSPGQGTQTRLGVYPLRMHWSARDWHVLSPGKAKDYSSLAVTPGSPEATANGWLELKHA